MRKSTIALTLIVALVPVGARGVETQTFTYDAKGRLVKVLRTGTVNNNVQSQYTHDKANNRKNITVTGSPNPPPP